jgi:hypothetical protein
MCMVVRCANMVMRDEYLRRTKEEESAASPKCGNCARWMKRGICPREHGVGDPRGGPSAGGLACGKYVENAAITAIHRDRAIEYAQKARMLKGGA